MEEPAHWKHGLDLSAPPRGVVVREERSCVRLRVRAPGLIAHLAPLALIAAACVGALVLGMSFHHGAGLLGAMRWMMITTASAGLAFAVPISFRIALATREIVLTQGVLIMRDDVRVTCLREGVRAVRISESRREGAQLEVEAEFSDVQARVTAGHAPEVGDDERVMMVLVLRGETRARAAWLARVVAAWAEVEVLAAPAARGDEPSA